MLNTTFTDWPCYSQEEAEAISRVLLSNRVNYWTGPECQLFESEFAEWAEVPHAVALNNGTVALEAALDALRVGPGDEVIVTPRSFVASATCVLRVGATPVFADIDSDTQNLSAETIACAVTRRTKAVIVVHLAGMPADMAPITELAEQKQFAVIEDCAQAHGARYRGQCVGSFGDVGVWSFCQDKIITTAGEGGMVTAADEDLRSRMWSYKDHGKDWHLVHNEHEAGFRWLHATVGTNGRMIEIQAVIGRIQLRRLSVWHAVRLRNASRIWSAARDISGLRVPLIPEWAEHAAYRAYVFVEPEALSGGWNRDRIVSEINACGVPCFQGSCSEIYLEKVFERTNWRPGHPLPIARRLGETSLAFLVHPTLLEEHIDRTCQALADVMKMAVG